MPFRYGNTLGFDYSAAPQLLPALTASINVSTASSSLPLQFHTWQYTNELHAHLSAYFKTVRFKVFPHHEFGTFKAQALKHMLGALTA